MLKLGLIVVCLLVGSLLYYLFRKASSASESLPLNFPERKPEENKDKAPDRFMDEWVREKEEIVLYDLARYDWSPPQSLERLEKEIAEFLKDIPPPEILSSRLYQLLANPESNVKEIARIISLDPILTAEVLRVANSAFFRTAASRKITSVHRAIVLMGYNQLRMILLHYFFRKTLDRYTPLSREEIKDIWKHCVEVSSILGYFAIQRGYDPGLYITAGILHDVGKFFLPLFGEEGSVATSYEEDLPPLKEEEIRYGFGHHLLGGLVVRFWNLPSEIYAAAAYHHPITKERFWDLPPEERKLAAWVAVADHLSHLYGHLEKRYAYRLPGWIYRVLDLKGPVENLVTGELLSHIHRASLVTENL